MKKRVLASLATIALASTLVGGATFAIFTDSSTNDNNTFKAGTLTIQAGAQNYDGVAIDNIAPGDTIDGSFTVQNTGSLELRFDTAASTKSGDLFSGATPATVTIDNASDVVLAPGDTTNVTYHVNLPVGANNDYQGVSGQLGFTVNAEQTANN